MTEITQADHDAAVDWYSPRESEWTGLLAEAFARHREQAAAEERAKIVAYLRKGEKEFSDCDCAAELIEQGIHLEGDDQ